MQKTFDFISDPGHGWGKVPKALLQVLGIDNQISRYSYMRGEYAYLEEDCDLSKFHIEYRVKFGVEPKYRERIAGQKSSRVRGYDTYQV